MLVEVLCGDIVWDNFTNQDALDYALNPWRYDETLMGLQDELKEEFWIMAKAVCTERQLECLTMYAHGYTQMEIAKALDVNQSSVTKALYGNVDYKNGKKTYGGVVKKLKKAVKNSQKIQSLLIQIRELREEKL